MEPPERAGFRNCYKKRGCSLSSDSLYTLVLPTEHGTMGNINMNRRQYIKHLQQEQQYAINIF